MALRFKDGQGLQALDSNQILELVNGNSVVSGCDVTDGTGDLDADIASGTVIVDGSEVSVSSQTVTHDSADPDNPRKDLVVIDSGGNAQIKKGTAEDPEPEGAQRFDLFQPAPPSRDNEDGAVIAEIFVGANASDFGSSDIRDRRLISDLTVSSLTSINDLDLTSNNILNLADPVNAQDAATKNYVDSEVTDSQVDIHDDGSSVVSDVEIIDFKRSDFDATDDGSDTAGVEISTDAITSDELDRTDNFLFSGTVGVEDDTSVEFGNLPDFSIFYDSSASELKLKDEDNNTVKQRWDKNGDVFFPNGAVGIKRSPSVDLDVQGKIKTIDREIYDNSSQTVNVPEDFNTIQEAVDNCPMFLDETDTYLINVDAGTYNEDVVIQHVYGNGKGTIEIRGADSANPSDTQIDTVYVGETGANVVIRNVELISEGTQIRQSDEDSALVCEQAKWVIVRDTNFANTTVGATAYRNGELAFDQTVDFQQDTAIRIKHGGRAITYNAADITGSVTNLFDVQSGNGYYDSNHSISFTNLEDTNTASRGYVYNVQSGGQFDFLANDLAVGSVASGTARLSDVGTNQFLHQDGGTAQLQVEGTSSGANGLSIIRDGVDEWSVVGRGSQNNNFQVNDLKNDSVRLEIDKSTGDVSISDKLKLNDNLISNQSALDLKTNGGGSDILRVVDGTDDSTFVRFNEGGDVQFKNSVQITSAGKLDLSNQNIENVSNQTFDKGTDTQYQISMNTFGGAFDNSDEMLRYQIQEKESGSDLGYLFALNSSHDASTHFEIFDSFNDNSVLLAKDDGEVRISSGPLNFENSNNIQSNGTDVIQVDSNQRVTVPNNGLDVGTQADPNSEVNIEPAAIEINRTDGVGYIKQTGNNPLRFTTVDGGGGDLRRMEITSGSDTEKIEIFNSNMAFQSGGQTIRGHSFFEGQDILSSAPSSPSAGDWYIDDGSNTSSGNLGIRIYDGTNWIDQN